MKNGWYSDFDDGYMNSDDAKSLCNLPSYTRIVLTETKLTHYKVHITDTDRYTVYFYQCSELSDEDAEVTVYIHLKMFSPGTEGSGPTYLTIDLAPLLPVAQFDIIIVIIFCLLNFFLLLSAGSNEGNSLLFLLSDISLLD